jgi:uncharacterized protein (TIRG00374 family)
LAQSPPHRGVRRHPGRAVALRAVLALGVVTAVFVGILPRLADLSKARHQAGSMGGLDIATLGIVSVVGLLVYAFVLTAVMPGLSLCQAFVVNQSSTAVANTMPAGGVLGVGVSYRFYGSWGHSRSAITLNVLLTGIGNFLCKLGFPIVALVVLAVSGNASPGLVVAALVGLVAFTIVCAAGALGLASERLAQRVGRGVGAVAGWVRDRFRRPAAADAAAVAVAFRRESIELLRRRGLRLSVGIVAYHATQFALLLVALRGVGVTAGEVSWGEALAAYSTASLLGALPITPGGIGVVELGMTAALIAAGAPNAEAVAAVLVYRTVSYLLPLPLGAVTYFVWRWNARWRRAPAPAGVEVLGAT